MVSMSERLRWRSSTKDPARSADLTSSGELGMEWIRQSNPDKKSTVGVHLSSMKSHVPMEKAAFTIVSRYLVRRRPLRRMNSSSLSLMLASTLGCLVSLAGQRKMKHARAGGVRRIFLLGLKVSWFESLAKQGFVRNRSTCF
jgi:hypothetical protein